MIVSKMNNLTSKDKKVRTGRKPAQRKTESRGNP